MPYADPDQKRRYQREWKSARRAAWLAEHGPCIDCGTWDGLEVDHVDASLKVTHSVWSWSQARRDIELAKCVVRCKPCHLRKGSEAGDTSQNGRRNGQVKITEDDVRAIRASGKSDRVLAREFGLSRGYVWKIKNRWKWAWLE